MTDKELNDHLTALQHTISDAHETLRGVQDALAVVNQTTDRVVIEDPDQIDPNHTADPDRWRSEASLVSRRTTLLLWQAASILEKTARDIRPKLEAASPPSAPPRKKDAQESSNESVSA